MRRPLQNSTRRARRRAWLTRGSGGKPADRPESSPNKCSTGFAHSREACDAGNRCDATLRPTYGARAHVCGQSLIPKIEAALIARFRESWVKTTPNRLAGHWVGETNHGTKFPICLKYKQAGTVHSPAPVT